VVVLTTGVICEESDDEEVAVVETDVERVVAGTAIAKGEAALPIDGEALRPLGKNGEFGGWFCGFPWLGGICGGILSEE
jgi:hypothetical protein